MSKITRRKISLHTQEVVIIFTVIKKVVLGSRIIVPYHPHKIQISLLFSSSLCQKFYCSQREFTSSLDFSLAVIKFLAKKTRKSEREMKFIRMTCNYKSRCQNHFFYSVCLLQQSLFMPQKEMNKNKSLLHCLTIAKKQSYFSG